MTERERYMPGVPCWVDTSHPDPAAAAEFYGGLFGWELEDAMPAGSQTPYYMARLQGGDVGAVSGLQAGDPGPARWNSYVWVDSADEAAAKVRDAGGSVLAEPFDVMESGRMAVLADPEGAAFCVWEPRNHRGATVVNEHGSVNFNNLHTRDLPGAERFYRAVFGWRRLEIGAGGMWALPGYGDLLEERNPGTRERMGEMGAPAGFEDVVAGIVALGPDEADIPAHWSVTFATSDADATAKRASELGGTVVAGPFDAPWTRMAVIADPQGATFIASQFIPENKDLPAESAGATA